MLEYLDSVEKSKSALFLPHSAVLARCMLWSLVCPFVCPSEVAVLSEWLKRIITQPTSCDSLELVF